MIFQTTDEKLVKETVVKQRKEDFQIFYIMNTIFYVALMLLIIFVVLLNIYHYEYGSTMYGISFGFVAFSLVALILIGLLKLRMIPIKAQHKEWKKKIKQPDIIEVCDDLSLRIKKDLSSVYYMKKITAINVVNKMPFLMKLHGDLSNGSHTIEHQYTLIAFMEQQDILNQLILLNYQVARMELYRNETLKKIMQMNIKNRQQLFLKELLDSQVFLAVHLQESDKQEAGVYAISDMVQLAYQREGNSLCIYTDYDELDEQTKQRYPRGYLLPFQDVLKHVMKQSNTLFTLNEGIILNPCSSRIEFSFQQVKQLYQLGGQENGNYRN